jgi:ankyrin repeat protein
MSEQTLSRTQDKVLADLTRAIYLGETATALALIATGLPFDRIARGVSHTPLMAAIENGDMAVFEALLAAGAGIGPQNEHGETPLHAAAHRG